MTKKKTITGIAIGLIATTTLAIGLVNRTPEHLKFKGKILYQQEQGEEVVYAYVSQKDVKPEKNEDIKKRTTRSQFFLEEKTNDKEIWTGRFYSGDTFYEDENSTWFQIETATTTKKQFKKQTNLSWFDRLFFKEAFAEIDNVYSDSGDGNVGGRELDSVGVQAEWDALHDSSSETHDVAPSDTDAALRSGYSSQADYWYISRIFLPFDTSGIPDGATITAASTSIYKFQNLSGIDYGTQYAVLIQTSQDSTSTLIAGDYDQAGAINNPTEGSDTRQQIDNTSGYREFGMNATGIGWIDKIGYTLLGIRCALDADDTLPTIGSDECGNTFYMSEQTGTSTDPYMIITYTEEVGGADYNPNLNRVIIIE